MQPPKWTSRDSAELYAVERWGAGFFAVDDAGDVLVVTQKAGDVQIKLPELVADLRRRGLRTPMLIRFSDVLAGRISELARAFEASIESYGYGGRHRCAYPIKVNQQRHVVEEVIQAGSGFGLGLEAGSKPELLIALALLETPDAPIICNGYKDSAYVETALLAQRLGRRPIIVVERYHELELIIKTSRELGIRPRVGLRARLTAKGAGKWIASTGRRSKFGLSPAEIVAAVDRLRSEAMLDCLELLHFHIGSQITAIRAHKDALCEISRIYEGVRIMGADSLRTIDVGGGLGVDYDGSATDSASSMNYSLQEYANDVIAALHDACEESGIPHPDVITESGRSLVAHHAVLVFDVLGVTTVLPGSNQPSEPQPSDPKIVRDLADLLSGVNPENVQECYHDLLQLRDEAASSFALGYLTLSDRARLEQYEYACGERILEILREMDPQPEDLLRLERELADTYYGNFSVFQSAPDHWAVKQLFPVMPIQRLDEEPTRRGIFADLTCDSDGKIDRFIGAGAGAVKDVLELTPWNDAPYYIGVFLVGAYQEILGDLHNLFGDTDAVHVSTDDDGSYVIEHVVEGDAVWDVLRYVQYEPRALIEKVRRVIENSLRRGEISLEESARLRKRYEQGLRDYTYLSQAQ